MIRDNRYQLGLDPLSSFEDSGFKILISILLLFHLFGCSGCSEKEESSLTILQPDAVFNLEVKEPSDLCFGSTTDILYTVSDNTAQIYKITTRGQILETLKYTGSDLEGVTQVNNQSIYAVEERLRSIEQLDLQGNPVGHFDIVVENNDDNAGLEGIAYNSVNKCFYLLNEQNPGLLIITDEHFNILKEKRLEFADDYSGICIDEISQELWIVSDLSATVVRCNPDGDPIEQFRIPVSNPEGIAIDFKKHKLYVVSDREARLYTFTIKN